MSGRIPFFLQGHRIIHHTFWLFGLYASDKEEEIVTSYRTYRKNPTQKNWESYQAKHHWISDWAEQNEGRPGEYKAMFIPPLDSRPRVQLMQKVRVISELENPFFESLKEAKQEFERTPNPKNKKNLEGIRAKFNHIVMDWKVETGVLEKDPRGIDPQCPERPKNLPRFPFPSEASKSYRIRRPGLG